MPAVVGYVVCVTADLPRHKIAPTKHYGMANVMQNWTESDGDDNDESMEYEYSAA